MSLEVAKKRGAEAKQKLLEAEGGSVTFGEFLPKSGLIFDEYRQRLANYGILYYDVDGDALYPLWQTYKGNLLPFVGDVLFELRDHDPWMTAQFFFCEVIPTDEGISITPLQALRDFADGKSDYTEVVLREAQLYLTHGAR